MNCEFCQATLPPRTGKGRPASYCGIECRRGAEHLAGLVDALAAAPRALAGILERLEGAATAEGAAELTDTELRRVRAAAFSLVNRRRLVPGSSGRYTRRARAAHEDLDQVQLPLQRG